MSKPLKEHVFLVASLVAILSVGSAEAQSGLAGTFKPVKGYIDDAVALSADGKRVAYLETDSQGSTLVIREAKGEREVGRLELSNLGQLRPLELEFTALNRVLLMAKDPGTGAVEARLFHLTKPGRKGGLRMIKRFPPATRYLLGHRGRRPVIVSHSESVAPAPRRSRKRKTPHPRRGEEAGGGTKTRHELTFYDGFSGGRYPGAKTRHIDVDETGKSDELGFRITHWRGGHLEVVGIRDGQYDPKIDQRRPDVEARYDVLRGKFVAEKEIADLVKHRQNLKLLTAHSGDDQFVAFTWDRSDLLVVRDGVPRKITRLGRPLYHYDPDSLRYRTGPDGNLYFSLTIDPVHPDAAAKRRAVEVYIDIFKLPAGMTRPISVAHIHKPDRDKTWWVAEDLLLILPRHIGWSRGGKRLEWFRWRKKR